MESGQKEEHQLSKNQSKVIIQIPSYEEVAESSKRKSQSLFNSSPSFSQAFSSIKKSEFYTPPPPAPASASPGSHASIPRQVSHTEAPSFSTLIPTSARTTPPSLPSSSSTQARNVILVSHRQKGNPLLKHIRNVRWEFANVVCDYLLGPTSCALYISLRYHLLHSDYLYYRIRELQKNFKLRVVLCHVDVEDVVKPLLEVTKTALLHDCTLLCAWSLEECGRYLETIKVYENKPADLIQGQMDTDYLSRLTHALTAVRHVNKTDVITLGSTFGSLSHVMDASMEDLARCPGIGERKVKRLYDTFHEPFKRVVSVCPRQSHPEPSRTKEVSEVEKEGGDGSQQRKKEPELTVKSALSTAFAKYTEKVSKRKTRSEKGTPD